MPPLSMQEVTNCYFVCRPPESRIKKQIANLLVCLKSDLLPGKEKGQECIYKKSVAYRRELNKC